MQIQWAVKCSDEQGDDFVVGPFQSLQDARAWAATDAEERAEGKRHLINASEDGLKVWIGEMDDATASWSVVEMVKP